jgi:hypothetical protein
MAGCGDSMAPSAGATEGPAVGIDARPARVGSVHLGGRPATAAATFGRGRGDLNLGGGPSGIDPEEMPRFGYSFPFPPCGEKPRAEGAREDERAA